MDLAARAGLQAASHEAGVLDAARTLGADRFGLVHVAWGVFNRLPDLEGRARQAAARLGPGGRLSLQDAPPTTQAMDPTPTGLAPRFTRRTPDRPPTFRAAETGAGDPEALPDLADHKRVRPISPLVAALPAAGLRIEAVREGEHPVRDNRPGLAEERGAPPASASEPPPPAREPLHHGEGVKALVLAALAWAVASAAMACEAPQIPCPVRGPFGEGDYRLSLPDGEGPFPAVIALHGWGGRAGDLIASPAMAAPFLARGWAVIAPQGLPRRPGDAGGTWNSRGAAGTRDDVAFLRAVAEDAAARAPLDRARMLLSGFSGGGMMVWRIACDAPGIFAAYAPVAGLLWRPLPDRCSGGFRMLHTHGWADDVVPLEGRTVGGGAATQGDLFQGLDLLRDVLGCPAEAPTDSRARGPFLIREWDCPDGDLAFALHPGGHLVPEGWADLTLDWIDRR